MSWQNKSTLTVHELWLPRAARAIRPSCVPVAPLGLKHNHLGTQMSQDIAAKYSIPIGAVQDEIVIQHVHLPLRVEKIMDQPR